MSASDQNKAPASSTPSSGDNASKDSSHKMVPLKQHPLDLRSLMSPPEAPPHESFAHASLDHPMDARQKSLFTIDGPPTQPAQHAEPNFPISPPVSPATKLVKNDAPQEQSPLVRDPILYPHVESQPSSQQAPLFADDSSAARRAVKDHVAARVTSLFREASPPREREYALALEFKSQVAKAVGMNPRLWLERERGYLKATREARRYLTIAPAASRRSHAGPAGVRKAAAAPRALKAPRVVKPPRPAPDPTKRVVREDKDFNALPDYCPPVSSLPNKPNALKVEWRGVPLDLADDPHAHLLHPDEILLASNLRLDCATYLTSKRRIFIKRIEALRIGKEFRKTDAQQACKIDVNKASKLWQAFEKVGWLNASWVSRYA